MFNDGRAARTTCPHDVIPSWGHVETTSDLLLLIITSPGNSSLPVRYQPWFARSPSGLPHSEVFIWTRTRPDGYVTHSVRYFNAQVWCSFVFVRVHIRVDVIPILDCLLGYVSCQLSEQETTLIATHQLLTWRLFRFLVKRNVSRKSDVFWTWWRFSISRNATRDTNNACRAYVWVSNVFVTATNVASDSNGVSVLPMIVII